MRSVIILVIAAFFYVCGNGQIPLAIETAKCGHQPVVATSFLTSTYVMPGDEGYGPAGLFSRYYCAEAEAQAAGYKPAMGTTAYEKQAAQNATDSEAEAKAEHERLINGRNYKVYLPNTSGYSYTHYDIMEMNGGAIQTFYDLKKDGTIVANVREGTIGNEYEICQGQDQDRPCTVAGKDSKGREVKTDGDSVVVRIGNTFVMMTGIDEDFTLQDAIQVIGELKEEQ